MIWVRISNNKIWCSCKHQLRPSFYWSMCKLASFPGLPTVQFWLLVVCKNRGGRPGLILKFLPQVLKFQTFAKQQKRTSPAWFKTNNMCTKCVLNWRSLSSSVYLGRHWCHSCDKTNKAFPHHLAYCKRSQTGQWEGLYMNEAMCKHGFYSQHW